MSDDPRLFYCDGHGDVRYLGRWHVRDGAVYLLCRLPARPYKPVEEAWLEASLITGQGTEANLTKARVMKEARPVLDAGLLQGVLG